MEEKNELYVVAIIAVVAVVAMTVLTLTGNNKVDQAGDATGVAVDSAGDAIKSVTSDGTIYRGTTVSQLCTDSDGGYNVLEKGIVQLYDASQNIISTYTDTCFDSKLNTPVSECKNYDKSGTCTYKEFSCVDNNKDGIKETYNAMIPNPEDACPNGCSDGACLPIQN